MAPAASGWQQRPAMHRHGVMGILLALLLFIIGFSVPAWTRSLGLWMSCQAGVCTNNIYSHADAWMNAVRVMECLALVVFVICIAVEVFQDFCHSVKIPWCGRAVEILAYTAGIFSSTGLVVFGIHWSNYAAPELPVSNDSSHNHAEDHDSSLVWGFALTVTASVVVLLSAITITYSHCIQARSVGSSKASPISGVAVYDVNGSFESSPDIDSSSMMLVPAGHFDTVEMPGVKWSREPPPYSLPPPYPYLSNCDFFLPLANSSMIPRQVSSLSALGEGSDAGQGAAVCKASIQSPAEDNADHQEPVNDCADGDHDLSLHCHWDGQGLNDNDDSLPCHHDCEEVTDTKADSDHSQSCPGADAGFAVTPEQTVQELSGCDNETIHHPVIMRPVFVKAWGIDGASDIQITASAQTTMDLPSPYNKF